MCYFSNYANIYLNTIVHSSPPPPSIQVNEWFIFTLKPSWSEMFCLAIGLEYFVGDSDSIRGG
jgi:hypothetical protein